MKRFVITGAMFLALLITNSKAGSAAGSLFGSLCTAQPVGMGAGYLSVGIGIADMTSITAGISYGLSDHTDGRLRIALVDEDNLDTEIALGADIKYEFISVDGVANGPFDMALGAFVEYVSFDPYSVFLLGGQFIGSYPIRMENGRTLTPYGRFNVRIESTSHEATPPRADRSGSDLEFGLNGGVKWEATDAINLFGEFQIDGNDGIFIGVDFRFL